MPKCVSLRPLLTPKRPLKYQVPKTPKRCNFRHQKKPKYWHLRTLLTPKRLQMPENSIKVQQNLRVLKKPKRCIFWCQNHPSNVSFRLLLTPKRLLCFLEPQNSKKVQFQAPEKAKILAFEDPFNTKKASDAWKLQKGAFSGARKSQYVREILYPQTSDRLQFSSSALQSIACFPSLLSVVTQWWGWLP